MSYANSHGECQREIARLRAEVDRLSTTTYCAFCGATFALDDKAPNDVANHVLSCDKHPLAKRILVLEKALANLRAFPSAESYAEADKALVRP
jgi:hypothetical protein